MIKNIEKQTRNSENNKRQNIMSKIRNTTIKEAEKITKKSESKKKHAKYVAFPIFLGIGKSIWRLKDINKQWNDFKHY